MIGHFRKDVEIERSIGDYRNVLSCSCGDCQNVLVHSGGPGSQILPIFFFPFRSLLLAGGDADIYIRILKASRHITYTGVTDPGSRIKIVIVFLFQGNDEWMVV